MLAGKKILIGISGSIAAYKTITLIRLLVKAGAEVRVVMTSSASDFVSPVVLSTLSKNEVLRDLTIGDSWAGHVQLGRWADLMVIAPLSCNTLAKMAHGQCDNLLLAVYLSATCPVLCAPAMDRDMWAHPATKRNIQQLKADGLTVLDVEEGELASGLIGAGRMPEPAALLAAIRVALRSDELKGKSVLITAGPTHEAIDPVRFIANHSTGKMGVALAEAFYLRGAEVTVISGPGSVQPSIAGVQVQSVQTARDMYLAATKLFKQVNIAVLAAAVADYTPVNPADQKIKKAASAFELPLKKTDDILKTFGETKTGQLLVGFALETNNALDNARKKLQEKRADFIVLNSMAEKGAGFGGDTNKVHILSKDGSVIESNLADKSEIADFIIDQIIQ